MPLLVSHGAKCRCTFGSGACSLAVAPARMPRCAMTSIATITDSQPSLNIPGFQMCSSLTNPAVARATAQACGVLIPQPCTPVLVGTWLPGSLSSQIDGEPLLTENSFLTCAYGGVVSVVDPGQAVVEIRV